MAAGAENVKSGDKMKAYFRGVKAEIKKVIWPSKKELINNTSVVLFISVLAAVIVYVLDIAIGGILSSIIS